MIQFVKKRWVDQTKKLKIDPDPFFEARNYRWARRQTANGKMRILIYLVSPKHRQLCVSVVKASLQV